MADMLNLDDFVETERRVRLAGRDFKLRNMTVAEFMRDIAEEKARKEPRTGIEAFEKAIEELAVYLEPEDGQPADMKVILGALSIDKITALTRFARGQEVAEQQKAPR